MHIQIFDRDTTRLKAILSTVSRAAERITTSITVESISDSQA